MGDFIVTRAAQNKKNAKTEHSVTVYESHKKVENPKKMHLKKEDSYKSKEQESDEEMFDEPEEPMDERRKQELEMKRYRYEVIKFGMSGFEKQQARQAKIALAISLGAKPERKRPINYKRLQKERKFEKAKEQKKDKFLSGFSSSQLLMKNKKNDKSQLHHKKDKESNGILGLYGKVTKDNKRKGNNVQKRKS